MLRHAPVIALIRSDIPRCVYITFIGASLYLDPDHYHRVDGSVDFGIDFGLEKSSQRGGAWHVCGYTTGSGIAAAQNRSE